MKNLKEKILHSLQKSPQSLPIRTLLKRMKIMDKSKKAFFAALDELKAEGKVTVSKKKRVHLPHKDDTVEAAIVSLSRGFAFARPDDGGEDIFILGGKLNHAFVGDRVLLSHIQQSAKGPSADVEKVVEKSSRTTTGTFRSEGEVHTLIPDISVRYEIPVTRKSAALAKDGDKVQARIRTKLHSHELEAEIVKIYGRAGSAKICADAILDEYGIRTDFSKEALAEAEEAASREITPADLKGRLDLRKLSICTIDGADAKDLDDAISVSKKRDGGYRLGVHIADVSHYIPPDGALDLEARSRGTSVYFADRVVPMLPKSLSNGVCSLNAGEDKLTFSALIELDRSGNIESYRFRKSVIRSKVRGVYSEVNSLFDGTADRALRRKYTPVIRSLHAARELAAVLQRRFVQNGVIDLESTESVFTLNEDGICVDVRPRRSGEAEQ
ncbi:MAG: ribonuclease R, partial [Oscillospiraceae bacterium]|nr:ribonuclease R [Oscillospiraceae bacterium]